MCRRTEANRRRSEPRDQELERPLGLVILSEAKNRYARDYAWNPSRLLPIVILRFAQNDKSILGKTAPAHNPYKGVQIDELCDHRAGGRGAGGGICIRLQQS